MISYPHTAPDPTEAADARRRKPLRMGPRIPLEEPMDCPDGDPNYFADLRGQNTIPAEAADYDRAAALRAIIVGTMPDPAAPRTGEGIIVTAKHPGPAFDKDGTAELRGAVEGYLTDYKTAYQPPEGPKRYDTRHRPVYKVPNLPKGTYPNGRPAPYESTTAGRLIHRAAEDDYDAIVRTLAATRDAIRTATPHPDYAAAVGYARTVATIRALADACSNHTQADIARSKQP